MGAVTFQYFLATFNYACFGTVFEFVILDIARLVWVKQFLSNDSYCVDVYCYVVEYYLMDF